MNFSMKRMTAIFIKDVKELSKNMFVSVSLITPILLAALYSNMGLISISMINFIINLSFTFVGAFIQGAVIAEEKEKNTLRGLMLSPASTLDILGGKSLVSFFATILSVIICSWLIGYEPENLFIISIAIIISTIFYIAVGTILGLLTKSVMEASVWVMPIIFLFGFGSLMLPLVEEISILTFIEYMPNVQLEFLVEEVQNGAGFANVWTKLAIIGVWTIVGIIAAAMVYKKRRMDD